MEQDVPRLMQMAIVIIFTRLFGFYWTYRCLSL